MIHFLAIGLMLFVGSRLLARDLPRAPIEVDSTRIAELRNNWARQAGGSPSDAQLQGLVRQTIDDEILFREAVAAGLMDADSVVQRRLLLNAQFLGLENKSDAELLKEARALGLHLSDPVVRRRLVQLMRSAIFAAARAEVVEDEEQILRELFESSAANFVVAPRLRMSHIFIGRSADGAYGARAKAVHEELQRDAIPMDFAIALGDPFLRGHRLSLLSQRELEGYFGPDLASEVFEAPLGSWSEPIESAYGLHLVFVEELQPARQQSFEEVRERIRDDWQREREQLRLRKVLDQLRGDYEIRMADLGEPEA